MSRCLVEAARFFEAFHATHSVRNLERLRGIREDTIWSGSTDSLRIGSVSVVGYRHLEVMLGVVDRTELHAVVVEQKEHAFVRVPQDTIRSDLDGDNNNREDTRQIPLVYRAAVSDDGVLIALLCQTGLFCGQFDPLTGLFLDGEEPRLLLQWSKTSRPPRKIDLDSWPSWCVLDAEGTTVHVGTGVRPAIALRLSERLDAAWTPNGRDCFVAQGNRLGAIHSASGTFDPRDVSEKAVVAWCCNFPDTIARLTCYDLGMTRAFVATDRAEIFYATARSETRTIKKTRHKGAPKPVDGTDAFMISRVGRGPGRISQMVLISGGFLLATCNRPGVLVVDLATDSYDQNPRWFTCIRDSGVLSRRLHPGMEGLVRFSGGHDHATRESLEETLLAFDQCRAPHFVTRPVRPDTAYARGALFQLCVTSETDEARPRVGGIIVADMFEPEVRIGAQPNDI